MKRYASVGLGIAVGAAVLVPLYGEIRANRVSHPEWARMLVRALHRPEVVEATTHASQVFGILSWRESLSYRADRYFHGDKVAVSTEGPDTCVSGEGATGEVSYRVGIVRTGQYRLRARARGAASQPLVAQLARLEDGAPVATYDVVPAPLLGWSDARARPGGPRRLAPGGYVASFLVPVGMCLSQVEVVPPCLQPIEPLGGWKPRAVTLASDVAATLLKAAELESELPPAATGNEYPGSEFDVDDSGGQPLAIQAAAGPEMSWLRGGAAGTRALLMVTIPEDGLYNLSVLGRFAAAQRWGVDSCFEALVCPTGEKEGLRWRSVTSLSMMAGRHLLAVDLAPESIVARVKLERKKAAAEDYLSTLRRLGFDAGAEGPVSRRQAADAVGFLKARMGAREAQGCTDTEFVFPPDAGSARAGDMIALTQPVQPLPQTPPQAGQGLPPIAPPSIDPGPLSAPTPEPPPPGEPVSASPTPLAPTAAPPTPFPVVPTPPTPTPPTPLPPTPIPPTPVPTPVCSSPPCPP